MNHTSKSIEQIDAELLGPLTEAQRACVQCFGRPLVVSAGAGSGKTFMLTRRIAYALAHPELSGVESIDQVLAITFTTLAAGEIKARVRSTLRSIGMIQQASLVDSCWISTIHGMCSRILHEHALELGLDPSFGLIDETDAAKLRLDAINETIAHVSHPDEADEGEDDTARDNDTQDADAQVADASYARLFSEYDGGDTVKSMVESLLNAAANVPGGLDAVDFGPSPISPHDLAGKAYDALVEANAIARELGISAKGKQGNGPAWASKMLDVTMQEQGMPAFERLMAAESLTYEQVGNAIEDLLGAISAADVRSSANVKAYNRAFRIAIDETYLECTLGAVGEARGELLSLTREVQASYEAKKSQMNVLDTNDLMLKTLAVLRENRCGIADEYRNRFKLILVDEFQDTSDLQIDIISFLDGQNHERLCTVGDAQQSIYSFRGADVKTYLRFKGKIASIGGELQQLDKNYRSHGDVIQFVNTVFGREEVFGGADSEFIELDWDHGHAERNEYKAIDGRIGVIMTTSPHGTRCHKAPSNDDLLAVEATSIADRFCAIHNQAPAGGTNRGWGDMVILLGAMNKADVYAQALRERGVPCVITGGSIFDKTPEALLVCALARVLANPTDDDAMGKLLTSPLFALAPGELLAVAQAGRGSYWNGIRKLAHDGRGLPPRVALAAGTLAQTVAQTSSVAPSRLLTDVLTASGWLERKRKEGPQGLASAANALKAVRMAESFESDPHAPRGMASVAARMNTKFEEGMKEPPGALSARGEGAVRIMTIHASKGLEFPVVALGAFYSPHAGKAKLLLGTEGNVIHAALEPDRAKKSGGPFSLFSKVKSDYVKRLESLAEDGEMPDQASADASESPWAYMQALRASTQKDELAEMRRKFYVGATRPREELVLAMRCNPLAQSNAKAKAGCLYGEDIIEDVRGALCPSTDFESNPLGYEFGGDKRAWCRHTRMDKDQTDGSVFVQDLDVGDGERQDIPLEELLTDMLESVCPEAMQADGSQARLSVPEYADARELMPVAQPCDPLHAGVFSYSSVAKTQADATDPDETPMGKPTSNEDTAMLDGAPMPDGDACTVACRCGDPTAFGSAFHLAAQFMAETSAPGQGVPAKPGEARLRAMLRACGANDGQLPRLQQAVTRWAASDAAARAYAHPRVQAEAPLFVHVAGPDGEPLHLSGSIDLLCSDPQVQPADQRAFVVDYKTGGNAEETPEALSQKHLLQAQCYAYAVLSAGYAGVDLRFVRVEQSDCRHSGQSQEVGYAFERAQLQELADAIRTAYAAKARA